MSTLALADLINVCSEIKAVLAKHHAIQATGQLPLILSLLSGHTAGSSGLNLSDAIKAYAAGAAIGAEGLPSEMALEFLNRSEISGWFQTQLPSERARNKAMELFGLFEGSLPENEKLLSNEEGIDSLVWVVALVAHCASMPISTVVQRLGLCAMLISQTMPPEPSTLN